MKALDRLIPAPRLLQIDAVEIAAPIASVWEAIRYGDLARSPLSRALFALRTLPERWAGADPSTPSLRIDELKSTPDHPGFQLLVEEPVDELAVGAIGKVWQAQIPFVHVNDADEFAGYQKPGLIKVAWALQVDPVRTDTTRLAVELRVDATDEVAWRAFRRYFSIVGLGSRFVRHAALHSLKRTLETRTPAVARLTLPGDDLLPDAKAEITHDVLIQADPASIWPWLAQMGCDRAGFYSLDALDNAGVPSATEIHPEWQDLALGQHIAATPDGSAHFEVMQLYPPYSMVLGGLFDTTTSNNVAFAATRPEHYWHVSWAFSLRSESPTTTRLYVRARAAWSSDAALHAAVVRPIHFVMQKVQLHNLRERVEGTHAPEVVRQSTDRVLGGLRTAWESLRAATRGSR